MKKRTKAQYAYIGEQVMILLSVLGDIAMMAGGVFTVGYMFGFGIKLAF